ncbi:MAG: DUF4114 domain-containing protein [Symploca sp. SIO1C4]|uniref:DUF4114 domain-containing protein n=1 Tax=Symploca sp. SIO1C4 TaxID=2607765 RepID=A0A6B3N7P4_9CYAN|nr:DUF4114 domain-containing protein [Symploca sp. SIO1C4]
MANFNSVIFRDPFAKGTLILNDQGITIRNIDGTNNNLSQVNLGTANTSFIRFSSIEYEDGIKSPAGVAFDAEDNPLIGVDGNIIKRQPIPIFTIEEKDRLIGLGFNVITNSDNLSNVPEAAFVLLNPPNRPSTRMISNAISNLEEGESAPNANDLSAFIWNFGQFINHSTDLAAEDVEDEQADADNFPIDIPADDPIFGLNTPPTQEISRQTDGGLQFDFHRQPFTTGTGVAGIPGKVNNIVTSWLDLSTVYGSGGEESKAVRAFSGGRLKVFSAQTTATNDDLLPINFTGTDGELISGQGAFMGVGFLAGDTRVNENDNLASQHTLWMRNHNRLALELSRFHPEWTDEQIFQRARQINIAQFQNIVFYEWLPLMIGDIVTPYRGYQPTASPEISDEFAAAGLRVGHTQVNNHINKINAEGDITTIPFLSAFSSAHIQESTDVDSILRGNSQIVAEDVDTNVVFDLRNALIPGAIGFDIYAANQQRGRDRGLADYNQVRDSLGLPRVTSFAEITSEQLLANTLEELYLTVEDIDLLVGLFSEDAIAPSGAGETLQNLLWEQYERIRAADRFWFERSIRDGGFFTPEEIAEIQKVNLSNIIQLNTEITNIPEKAFLITSQSNLSSDRLLDLTGLLGQGTATVTREAAYDNLIGFYVIDNVNGTVNGINPGETGYAEAALTASVVEFSVENNLTTSNFEIDINSGTLLAPYIIKDGNMENFLDGQAEAYFTFEAANSDGMSHILELANGRANTFTFAFEDMTGLTSDGSDRDFNDMVLEIMLV